MHVEVSNCNTVDMYVSVVLVLGELHSDLTFTQLVK